MWTALIGPIAELAGGFIKNKQETVQAKQKLAVAKIEAQVTKVQQDGNWEETAMKASDNSWKDEFALVVLLLPAILVFIPSFTEYVRTGFEVLNTLPDWYQYLLFIAVSSSFGIKGVGQAMKLMGKK